MRSGIGSTWHRVCAACSTASAEFTFEGVKGLTNSVACRVSRSEMLAGRSLEGLAQISTQDRIVGNVR